MICARVWFSCLSVCVWEISVLRLIHSNAMMLVLSAIAFDIADSTSNPNVASVGETSDVSGDISDNMTYKMTGVSGVSTAFDINSFGFDWTFEKCSSWQRPPNHLYFQLANALFFIAFLAPYGSYGLLCARFALVVASILMTLWSYLIECTVDAVVWSGSFLVVNVIYLIVLIYRFRPIRFEKEIEAVSVFFFSFFSFFS